MSVSNEGKGAVKSTDGTKLLPPGTAESAYATKQSVASDE